MVDVDFSPRILRIPNVSCWHPTDLGHTHFFSRTMVRILTAPDDQAVCEGSCFLTTPNRHRIGDLDDPVDVRGDARDQVADAVAEVLLGPVIRLVERRL